MTPIEPFKSGEPIVYRQPIKGGYGWPGHDVPGTFVAGDVEHNRRVLIRVRDTSGRSHSIYVKGSNVSRADADLKLAKADIREAEREIVRLTAALERKTEALTAAVVRAKQADRERDDQRQIIHDLQRRVLELGHGMQDLVGAIEMLSKRGGQ